MVLLLIFLYAVTIWSFWQFNLLINSRRKFCCKIWLNLIFWDLWLFYFLFLLLSFFFFFFTWISYFFFLFVKEINNFLFAFLACCEFIPNIVGLLNKVFIYFILIFLIQWWINKFIIIAWTTSNLKLFKVKSFLQSFFFQLSFLFGIRLHFLAS